ncbi:MAG: radical SAM protein [Clostridia bacterium]|nr:radical SAM protein [Clostridia bacterium]
MHTVQAKSLLTRWNAMNVYRGCTHGCIYCDSRSSCYQFTHSFEDIEVKQNAPELLERTLRSRQKRTMISTGSMSDPYQPCEQTLRLTRQCLRIIEKYGFGAAVLTKSDRVLEDLPLLRRIHDGAKAVVQISLTCADDSLSRLIEPCVCPTSRRAEVLLEMKRAGIPTVVWMTPILPFLTDTRENVNRILDMCFRTKVRGIVCFQMGLTLRNGSREYYYRQLNRLFPGLVARYERTFGLVQEVESLNSPDLMSLFHERCAKEGVLHTPEDCFEFTGTLSSELQQLNMFD